MSYKKKSDENNLESMVIAKVVLLLASEQREKLNLRQLQKVLREINTVWYFIKGNTLFTEPFVKNAFNEWQLLSVWNYFCGCASTPIPWPIYEHIVTQDLENALNQTHPMREDIDHLVDLIKSILKQGKYKDPWSGNCYEDQDLVND